VCDLETSRIGAPYIYDISNLGVNIRVIKHKKMWPIKVFYFEFCSPGGTLVIIIFKSIQRTKSCH